MSQDTINRIAAALLPYVKTTAAGDVLLEAASTRGGAITEVEAEFSAASALTNRRGSVDKALTAAAGTSDPETLLAFAKDSRLSVQRFVADRVERLVSAGASTELFEPVLARLADQAYKRLAGHTPAYEDRDVLAVTARLRRLPKVLTDLGHPSFPSAALRARLIERLDESELRAALVCGEPLLAATVLEVLNHHPVGGFTLTEALALIAGTEVYSPAVTLAFFTGRVLDAELTEAFLGLDGDPWAAARTRGRRYGNVIHLASSHPCYIPEGLDPSAAPLPRFTVPAAVQLLAPGAVPDLGLHWVFDEPVHDEVFDLAVTRLGSCTDSSAAALFSVANAPFMDARKFELFVSEMRSCGYLAEASVVIPFRRCIPDGAPSSAVFEVLSHLDFHSVSSWLSGEMERKPLPGEVIGWLRHDPEQRRGVRETLSRCALTSFPSFLPTIADEVLDVCGSDLGQLVLRSSSVAARVAARIEAAVGDDEEVWRTVVTMCDALGDERIESLVAAVRITLGRPDEDVTVELFEHADGQLSFLP